jgi:DNA-binding transcriptional regulator YiaG
VSSTHSPLWPIGHGKVKVLTTRSHARIVDHVNAKQTLKLVQARHLAASGDGKAIREGAGLSLREVAGAISLSAAALFRWENGERIPRGERAVAWVEFLEQLAATRRAS